MIQSVSAFRSAKYTNRKPRTLAAILHAPSFSFLEQIPHPLCSPLTPIKRLRPHLSRPTKPLRFLRHLQTAKQSLRTRRTHRTSRMHGPPGRRNRHHRRRHLLPHVPALAAFIPAHTAPSARGTALEPMRPLRSTTLP